jgi:selenocysteine lyase/cysteine desulfurase
MARRSKEERKKAIDEHWMSDVPPFGIAGASVFLATKLAKLMIEHEEMVGLGDPISQETFDWDAATRKEQQEARWAAMELEAKPKRKKRKVSDYSKQFGIILKALKKKHPRTPVTRLMKKAHVATRKKMPKKTGRSSKGRKTIKASGQFRRDKLLPRKR